MLMRWLIAGLIVALLAGCAGSGPQIKKSVKFSEPAEKILYVVPFSTIMVPLDVEESVFDQFVDMLNAQGSGSGYKFVILKQDLDTIDRAELAEYYYLTGEIYGYVEESGCCSTNMRLKSRVQLFQPGQVEPTLQLSYPRETFFEHDYSTIGNERRKLTADISATLAEGILRALNAI
ncbi:MAG: hypothetical protein K0A93_02025 [Desulfuromonadaceae bacterium]|nr:hypothetical protein [Desulfuromonadaceae bacterium]